MPIITLDGPKLTKEQKEKLVKGFATTASEILNIPVKSFVTILRENEADNIGVGDEQLSAHRH